MYNDFVEEKLYYAIRNIREPILRPITKILVLLGFRPDTLSYLGVVFMLFFIYFIRIDVLLSFCFLIGALFMDILDGTTARYLEIQSDRGKFTDVSIDNLNFTLFVLGLTWASLVSGLVAAVYIYFMLLVKVLMIVKKNITKESDWLIRPMVGAFPNVFVYVSYIIFALYVFWGTDIFDFTFSVFSVLLVIKTSVDYWIIKNTVFVK